MIGFDAIGFHAIGEIITSIPAPIIYLPVSKPTSNVSNQFKTRNDYPIPVAPELDILWDDDTNIVWDDDSIIEFG